MLIYKREASKFLPEYTNNKLRYVSPETNHMLRFRRSIYYLLFVCFFLTQLYSLLAQHAFIAKNIEKSLAKITDSLYAGRYEVSNKEYNIFLQHTAKKDSALFLTYRSDSTQWIDVLRPCEPPTSLWYHRHPAFNDYPVVNINYDGAIAYCQWLTEMYNSDFKRKFKKVIFKLPTKDEWISGAQGGQLGQIYPWKGYDMVNKKGFYLCNFKPVGDPYYVRDSLGQPMIINYTEDHSLRAAEFPDNKGFYTAKVDSFTPNAFGMYNTSGNVAEMTMQAMLWVEAGIVMVLRSPQQVSSIINILVRKSVSGYL
jgi:hypothetical protein